jgi:ATP-dependent helicase/nuclease subunit A
MNLDIISAGAGSGKTYTLTQRIHTLIANGSVRPQAIIATTFTQKAAAELRERIKLKLLQEGMIEESDAIDQALIGTVHSIGTRILQRFAFQQGYSPLVEMIPEEEAQALFNHSISRILTLEVTEKLQGLCTQLGMVAGFNDEADHFDWRKELKELADLIRINNLDATAIEKSKHESWKRIESMLYQPTEEEAATLPKYADAWLPKLAELLSTLIETVETKGTDTTTGTASALESCRATLANIKMQGHLAWSDWARCSKLKVTKKSEEDAQPLITFCQAIEAHPQLRSDIKAYIDTIFALAHDAIREFQAFKKKRGVIDYSDMEVMLDSALDNASIKEVINAETDLLMVDEFQDTSPMQLSIFLKLSTLARKSIWVGDPKQSIYGFRGAEPALMRAVIDQTGGIKKDNILTTSYRSRTDIVHAVNAIFVKAFDDMPPEQVVLEAARKDEAKTKDEKALIHWRLLLADNEQKKPTKGWTLKAIATKIGETLHSGMMIQPKSSATQRPIEPGDIAVLCRTNEDCKEMAKALSELGLSVSMSQNGLHDTTEGKCLLAALRFLVDKNDTLSIAELLILTQQLDLNGLIKHRQLHLAPKAYDTIKTRWARDMSLIADLDALRKHIRDMSASEIIEKILVELDFGTYLAPFGNLKHRLANLEQFRNSSAAYELACARLQTAASLGGYLLWLERQSASKKDAQISTQNAQAINVLTYHKSKGLEYPMVICAGLEKPLKDRFWGLTVCSNESKPDLKQVLKGRHIELRVHPYGSQIQKTRLQAAVQASEVYQKETTLAEAEDARILYVGLTRARDYLVIPSTIAPTSWLNRVFNRDADAPTLQPDSTETPFYYPPDAHEPLYLNLQIDRYAQEHEVPKVVQSYAQFLQPMVGKTEHQELMIDIQNEQVFDLSLRQISPTWQALNLPDIDAEFDLEPIAQFLLGDMTTRPMALRAQLAEKQLLIHQKSRLTSKQLIQLSDKLHAELDTVSVEQHSPIRIEVNGRLLSFHIPKLIKTKAGYTICYAMQTIGASKQAAWQTHQNSLAWALYAVKTLKKTDQVAAVLICPANSGYWKID